MKGTNRMNVEMIPGMRGLTAAEILMVSGGDGGENDSHNYYGNTNLGGSESWQEARVLNWILKLGPEAFSIKPTNLPEIEWLKEQMEQREQREIANEARGIFQGRYDDRDSSGTGGDPGFW